MPPSRTSGCCRPSPGRGIATDLVRHQLRDIAARGEVVATLRASEATIYERYGYGVASSAQTVEVQTARAALRPGVAAGGPVRLLDAADVWDILPRIYTAIVRPDRAPSTAHRCGGRASGCAPNPPRGLGMSRCTANRAPSRASPAIAPSTPRGGSSAISEPSSWKTSSRRPWTPTGLLRFLLELDLIDRVTFWMLPLDDPLPWLLVDRRAMRSTAVHDETWLRVVDVRGAGRPRIRRRRLRDHRRQ